MTTTPVWAAPLLLLLVCNPTPTICLTVPRSSIAGPLLVQQQQQQETTRYMTFKRTYLDDEDDDYYDDDDNNNNMREPSSDPSTFITTGTKIEADTLTCANSIVVEGELIISDTLECSGDTVLVGRTGVVVVGGKILSSQSLVTVDGQVEGSVECLTLIVGPAGMVTGDVNCKDLWVG